MISQNTGGILHPACVEGLVNIYIHYVFLYITQKYVLIKCYISYIAHLHSVGTNNITKCCDDYKYFLK